MTEQQADPRLRGRTWIVAGLLGLGVVGALAVYGYRRFEDASDRST